MNIYLPIIRAEYPLHKKLLIGLFNWTFWSVPAVADTLADDVGPDYQALLALLVIFAFLFVVCLPPMVSVMLAVPWYAMAPYVAGAYLFFGLLYHWYNHSWGM